MKKEESYICPVCNVEWDSLSEAIKCRNSHPIFKRTWCRCEFCGQAWRENAFGIGEAERLARKCEQEHIDKNEVEEVRERKRRLEIRLKQMGRQTRR